MTHPIVLLQAPLVAAWKVDTALTVLIGADAVFDAPPRGKLPPYVAIGRHDMLTHDADGVAGHEHRLLVIAWAAESSRRAVLAIVERVVAVALGAALDGDGLVVTNRAHERTDTAIDLDTGRARAAVTLRFWTEAAA